jgi:hypothetical protein
LQLVYGRLSTLTKLERLSLEFESPLPCPVLIDAPLLNDLSKTFFHRLILETPQLAQFIARTPNSKHMMKRGWSFPTAQLRLYPHRHIPDISRWETVKLAGVVPGTVVQSVLTSGFHSHGGTPVHLAEMNTSLTERVGKTTLRTANG